MEWNSKIIRDLRSHQGLSPERSLAVQRDFGMTDGRPAVEVRLSMAYYLIERSNLDLPDLPPARSASASEHGRGRSGD